MTDVPKATGDDAKRAKQGKDTSGKVMASKLQLLQDTMGLVIVVLKVAFIGLLITVFFGFGALFQNYLANKQATYEDLRDQILIQGGKIDDITAGLRKRNIIP